MASGQRSLSCRRAHRDKQGNYDGESSDEDDERVAPPTVELRPVGDRSITVVATADLHRCHDDQYIHVAGSRYSLAEWFESAHAPPHVHQPRAAVPRQRVQRPCHELDAVLDGPVPDPRRLVRVGRARGVLGDGVRPDGHAHPAPHVHQPAAAAWRR